MRVTCALLLAAVMAFAFPVQAAETVVQNFTGYLPGSDPTDWLDTGPNNLDYYPPATDTFEVKRVDGLVLGTNSSGLNNHSHYLPTGSSEWMIDRFEGRMRTGSANAGIGVTFLSDYPDSDTYYSLIASPATDGEFVLSEHGTKIEGDDRTGVTRVLSTWMHFRIEIVTSERDTVIRAMVWAAGQNPPQNWQAEVVDTSEDFRTRGAIGVWSTASVGTSYWDDLTVTLSECMFDDDGDGVFNCEDGCRLDPEKTEPGLCGCGVVEDVEDADSDGVINCLDGCPEDPAKTAPGICGCGVVDDPTDTDTDGVPDCIDECPLDPLKTEPGICGCGVVEDATDTDSDGVADCIDGCPEDPAKVEPGHCGCGVADTDSDSDLEPDCTDGCPNDTLKIAAGVCGCGVDDFDADTDGIMDCEDLCPCSDSYIDWDSNGIPDICFRDTPEERVCWMFYTRAPLPKPHYDSSFSYWHVTDSWAGAIREYVRVARGLTVPASVFPDHHGNLAAMRRHVLAANASEPEAIPASFHVDYIPWMSGQPFDPGDLEHPYMILGREMMESYFQDVAALAAGNPGPADDILVRSVFFQLEHWWAKPNDPAYNQALTARANEAYLMAKQYFPDATVIWYHRGEVFWGGGMLFHQGLAALWQSGNFVGDELGDGFSTSLYHMNNISAAMMAYQYQMCLEVLRRNPDYGYDNTSPFIPVVALGSGYTFVQNYNHEFYPTEYESGDPNRDMWYRNLEYQKINDFHLGRFINLWRFSGERIPDGDGDPSDDPFACPALSPTALDPETNPLLLGVKGAEWHRAPFVVFFPSLFHHRRTTGAEIEAAANHFRLYFDGAVDTKCRPNTAHCIDAYNLNPACTATCDDCGFCLSCN